MFASLGLEIPKIDVALVVARHHNDLHPSHGGTCWVSTVGGRRNQNDVTVRFTSSSVISPNDQKTGELTLGTRVRLK